MLPGFLIIKVTRSYKCVEAPALVLRLHPIDLTMVQGVLVVLVLQ